MQSIIYCDRILYNTWLSAFKVKLFIFPLCFSYFPNPKGAWHVYGIHMSLWCEMVKQTKKIKNLNKLKDYITIIWSLYIASTWSSYVVSHKLSIHNPYILSILYKMQIIGLSGRSGFNPRSSHTKDSKNGTWCRLG